MRGVFAGGHVGEKALVRARLFGRRRRPRRGQACLRSRRRWWRWDRGGWIRRVRRYEEFVSKSEDRDQHRVREDPGARGVGEASGGVEGDASQQDVDTAKPGEEKRRMLQRLRKHQHDPRRRPAYFNRMCWGRGMRMGWEISLAVGRWTISRQSC